MKKLSALVLAVLLAATGLGFGASAPAAEAAEGPAAVQVEEGSVKQLRGKLLYKRNQIRKLEKAASAADTGLKDKVDALESERQALYVAAQPKLSELYAAEKALLDQINEMSVKK